MNPVSEAKRAKQMLEKISACGVNREEWLEIWKIPPDQAEKAWQEKLALDEKIVYNGTKIKGNFGIIADIQPYKSMIDGSVIDSRTKHRNHLKQHGCIEVGNEKLQSKKPEPPKGLKDVIAREVYSKLR